MATILTVSGSSFTSFASFVVCGREVIDECLLCERGDLIRCSANKIVFWCYVRLDKTERCPTLCCGCYTVHDSCNLMHINYGLQKF